MSDPEQQPRTAPTEGHLPTLLQVRCRVTAAASQPGELPVLVLVCELYSRREGRWARLTNRSYPLTLEQAMEGEGYLQAVAELRSLILTKEVAIDLRDEGTPP